MCWGADLTLGAVDEFLQNLKVGKSGLTFIVDRDGYLLASSRPEKPFRLGASPETLERLRAG